MELFNIASKLRKIDKECLLDRLLYIYSSSSNWDWADVLAKGWKDNNPQLFEKIDDLKNQAQAIMDDAITKLFDMVWKEDENISK